MTYDRWKRTLRMNRSASNRGSGRYEFVLRAHPRTKP
jgi:hypothetical protein